MMINWFKSYLFIFLLSVLPITGCMTSAQWEEELFGPSEHEKLMAKLDAQNAADAAYIATIDNAIKRYHRVAASISLGQSKGDVLSVLLPTQRGMKAENSKIPESFMNNGQKIDINYIRSARVPDGQVTDDEFTPYVFVDDLLVGIGWQSLGGAKTYGDANAAANARAANTQLLLGVMGLQNQQSIIQGQQQQQPDYLGSLNPPQVNCKTVYVGNVANTVCQ
ncbi:MAG: hypothetical protein HOC63_11740 [Rhodospirillales bacterium]|nr:hypothetical protein [Rhodospirillales bacterium]